MRSAAEDYIKHIYTLQASGVKVSTRNLAELLDISMPSVSEMVRKLTAEGFITSKLYHGFKLTSKGEKLALLLIRKHRLLEYFMINTLKYEWEDVHQEAERLEHSVSEKFINSLDYVLGFPKFDPHGHSIPDIKGKIQNRDSLPLSTAETGSYYYVSSVNDRSREILKYVKDLGIKLNLRIRITGKLAVDGSVIIYINGKKHLLSKRIADSIFVTNKKAAK
jgi:DtxR family Mn-dependent transcriptional regulator